jgi:serine/threonine protein kinase
MESTKQTLNINSIKPTKLKLSDYEQGQTLGTGIKYIHKLGSFGRVKIAKQKSTGKYFAIKILKKAEIIKLKQVDHIMNEVRILSVIDHPFLVRIKIYEFQR